MTKSALKSLTSGVTPPETMTLAGATRLGENIKSYWRHKGYNIMIEVKKAYANARYSYSINLPGFSNGNPPESMRINKRGETQR